MKKERYPWQKKKGRKENRFVRNRILIVCKGAKTEVNYFRKFPETIVLNKEFIYMNDKIIDP